MENLKLKTVLVVALLSAWLVGCQNRDEDSLKEEVELERKNISEKRKAMDSELPVIYLDNKDAAVLRTLRIIFDEHRTLADFDRIMEDKAWLEKYN